MQRTQPFNEPYSSRKIFYLEKFLQEFCITCLLKSKVFLREHFCANDAFNQVFFYGRPTLSRLTFPLRIVMNGNWLRNNSAARFSWNKSLCAIHELGSFWWVCPFFSVCATVFDLIMWFSYNPIYSAVYCTVGIIVMKQLYCETLDDVFSFKWKTLGIEESSWP